MSASGRCGGHLGAALDTAIRLRDAIATEVEDARRERQLLRQLDGPALLGRAAARSAFLEQTSRLERALAMSLAHGSFELGLRQVSVGGLRELGGAVGGGVADVLSEIAALAGALREIDQLNAELARRSLACVRGYLEALRPAPSAYGRRGERTPTAALSVVSSKG